MGAINSPSTSFGDELIAVLREGAQREVIIDFKGNENLAIRFVQRINALRSAMRKENHSQWRNLYRCGAYRAGATVRIGPKDTEFRQFITEAGVAAGPPLESTVVETEGGEPGAVDAFMADLKRATAVPPQDTDEEFVPKLADL